MIITELLGLLGLMVVKSLDSPVKPKINQQTSFYSIYKVLLTLYIYKVSKTLRRSGV